MNYECDNLTEICIKSNGLSEQNPEKTDCKNNRCQNSQNDPAAVNPAADLRTAADLADMPDTEEFRQLTTVAASAPVVDAFKIRIVTLHRSKRHFPRNNKSKAEQQRRQQNRHGQRQKESKSLFHQFARR